MMDCIDCCFFIIFPVRGDIIPDGLNGRVYMKNLKVAKPILLGMLVLSWLTLPLLGKKEIKRFLPASVLMSVLVALEMRLAKKRRWWWFYVKIHPKLSGVFLLPGVLFLSDRCGYFDLPMVNSFGIFY